MRDALLAVGAQPRRSLGQRPRSWAGRRAQAVCACAAHGDATSVRGRAARSARRRRRPAARSCRSAPRPAAGLHPRRVATRRGCAGRWRARRRRCRAAPPAGAACGSPGRPRDRPSPRRSGATTVPMSRPSITTLPCSAELALALAHHLAHGLVAGDDGTIRSIRELPDRRGDVDAGDEDAALARRTSTGLLVARARRAARRRRAAGPARARAT